MLLILLQSTSGNSGELYLGYKKEPSRIVYLEKVLRDELQALQANNSIVIVNDKISILDHSIFENIISNFKGYQ